MVSEDIFVRFKDREYYIAVRSMGIVPHAAGTGDNEDADGLDECVAPESTKYEGVEPV
jgi:hypothetical protein